MVNVSRNTIYTCLPYRIVPYFHKRIQSLYVYLRKAMQIRYDDTRGLWHRQLIWWKPWYVVRCTTDSHVVDTMFLFLFYETTVKVVNQRWILLF
jgi:hypothetical protein